MTSARPQGTSALATLEEAVHLLRGCPLSTVVCHLTGSVPFALAALRYWNDITNPRTSDLACALEALALALLLVWMNCWRAVFAGRLRRQLAGSPALGWTGRRLWNLVAGQAFFGATRLVMLPLATLVMFPLAPAVAFYRTTAVLAGHEDLDPAQVMVRSRRLAAIDPRQGWALLSILCTGHSAPQSSKETADQVNPGAIDIDQVHARTGTRNAIIQRRCQSQRRVEVMAGVDLFRSDHGSSWLDVDGDVRNARNRLQTEEDSRRRDQGADRNVLAGAAQE